MSVDASTPPRAPLRLPPRPARRPSPPRVPTLCFWTVFALFNAVLVYLGLLAFSAASYGPFDLSSGVDRHLLAGVLLTGAVIAALAAVIAARHHHDHHHHHHHLR